MQHEPQKVAHSTSSVSVECQNKKLGSKYCQGDFTIEPEDFVFYEKMKVPPPTFCPTCRAQRRFIFMNIYSLYKRRCDLCNKNIISMHHISKPYKVYCHKCWWSDSWDGTEYGKSYDPNKNFFEQLKELLNITPLMSLDSQSTTLINSEYTNYSSALKNCYLLCFADNAENCCYSYFLDSLKDTSDCYRITGSELCYYSVGLSKCFKVIFSEECDNCVNVCFSKNLYGCNNCFGCVNLRNKSYYIFNKEYSKEEYEKFIKNIDFNKYSEIEKIKQKARQFWLEYPVRNYYGNSLNINVTGNYVYESKNTKNAYMVLGAENCKNVAMLSIGNTKDCYDYTCWGANAELLYECVIAGEKASGLISCLACYPNVINNYYSIMSSACEDIFGCVGLKKKKYCILNKQYSKEEYEKLRVKIIENMKLNPFIDKNGRIYKYGEFFPYDLSPFSYNETIAQDFYPVNMKEINLQGFSYFEINKNQYKSTIKSKELLEDSICNENILNEIIECDCGKCFRFIENEINILKKLSLPLPQKCPDCRRQDLFSRVNLPNIYERKCVKCNINIQTSYAPDRPEIVYCEKCYQNEVY